MTNSPSNTLEPLHFTSFSLVRCIRIAGEGGTYCLPVDPRQNLDTLMEFDSLDQAGADTNRFTLLETVHRRAAYVRVDLEDDGLESLPYMTNPGDEASSHSLGVYNGIVWAIYGYLSENPSSGIQLIVDEDMNNAVNVHAAFEAMLNAHMTNSVKRPSAPAPVRVVVAHVAGRLLHVTGDAPIDVVMADYSPDASEKSKGYACMKGEPVGLQRGSFPFMDETGAIVDHFFQQVDARSDDLRDAPRAL
ncbi:hypothetical protein [Pseudomonas putida]|uniref:hypothetical protein n=1 Tax=Pseudomonas putida TaxID=303 RepID=UPI0038154AF6